MSARGQRRFKRRPRTLALSPIKAADQARAGPRAPSMAAARSASFVSGTDGHGGTLVTEAPQTANQTVPLTTLHTG